MNKTIATLAIAGSLAISLSAFANKGAEYNEHHHKHHDNLDWSKGWYIGAGVNGNAESTMDLNGTPRVFEPFLEANTSYVAEVEQSNSDIGFDVYVGRDISKHWAVELGYTYVGQQTFEVEGSSEIEDYDIEVNQWNVHLVGIGKLPIGEYFNVFAKGGVAYFSSTQEYDDEITETDFDNDDATINTMALTYGAGIEVTWDNWGVRGEYNVIWPATNVRDDFYVADIISANIYYKFD